MKQINIKLYFIFSILVSLFSCAEEGPYRMGKMDLNVSTSVVTPNAVIILIDRPNIENINLFGDVFLVQQPTKDSYNLDLDNAISTSYSYYDEHQIYFYFHGLTPQTTYYVITNPYFYWNKYQGSGKFFDLMGFYYTEFSFNTPKKGDYSGLGDAHCNLLAEQDGITTVVITLPDNLTFGSSSGCYVEASESPNMINAIRPSSSSTSYSSTKISANFKNLNTGVYYLRVYGNFISKKGNFEIKNAWINVKNTLDLSVSQVQSLP